MSIPTAIIICIIISSPFIWTLVRKFYKLKKKSLCSFFKTIFLDELSLHKQPLFWLLIASPVIISVTLWAIISPEYKLEWTAHGYAGLIKYGQLPLTILTLSPILGAFVISAHRSIQTEVQIKTSEKQLVEAQKKNKIDMYISNKNYILKELKLIIVDDYKIKDRNSLYKKAFNNINTYEVIRNNHFHDECKALITKMNEYLHVFIEQEYKTILDEIDQNFPFENYAFFIFSNASKLLKHLNIEPNIFYNDVLFSKNHYIDKIETAYYSQDETPPADISLAILYQMLGDFEFKLLKIIEVVNQTLLVLSDYENSNGVALDEIKIVKNTISNMHQQIGDKLAAENQNPPE
ncbi:hypothetical protein EX227_03485 [Providencia rettgeri]|uniref:Uncharacterized protein n=1 Tax=Providencia rettgeri TaxID=587 RepID=A0AAP2JW33_PRORE|nr:hypothetical protein [Providencia rettgeri]EMB3080670.1 hypothetical protein [Providencia rettgeri]MBX6956586.1 hypothetical protein [Providencia rettgeri]MBX6960360.1 hypothetical protein [Providencia rettgeri]MBX6970782.1 hypothetical protein [Providencia rettgeri]MBX6979979.1 hypothetical protein [Providencia rettgeri]